MRKKCVCVLLSAAMAMTMFAGCGNKDQASAGETNTVASADAEKSSETEGAEVNADESSGANMSARVDSDTPARYGDHIELAFDPHKIHVFDKETELTITN